MHKTADEGSLRIHLLGSFQIDSGLQPLDLSDWRSKPNSLIKLLALAPGHRLHKEQILETLWSEQQPANADNSLKQALHLGRKGFDLAGLDGLQVLHLMEGRIELYPAGKLWIDVEQFEQAGAGARRMKTVEAYEAALALYIGELLPEDRFEDWTVYRRNNLSALNLQLIKDLAPLYENYRKFENAIEWLNRGLEIDPTDEDLHVSLMRAYALNGKRSKALRQYERLQEALQRVLALEPDAATQNLQQAILTNRYPGKGSPVPISTTANGTAVIVKRPKLTREQKGSEKVGGSMKNILPTGTVTFLFTDIQGSTPLWEQMPGEMKIAVAQHHSLLRQAIEANGGQVFQIVGDAFASAFPLASHGLTAALTAQRSLQHAEWGATGPLKVRMGLHTGPAELDPKGDAAYAVSHTLNRVSRVMSAGHGGQILLSQEAADLVIRELPAGVSLKDLGEHHLKGMAWPEHLFQAVAPGLLADFPPLLSLDHMPNNLPLQLTRFIGREREVTELCRELSGTAGENRSRLITILGPGGAGKTRTAIQVADKLVDQFPDGVFWVELAGLVDGDYIPQAVVSALGIQANSGSPMLEILEKYLGARRVLIVLDNCEHLIEASASQVQRLLSACPGLSILTTSRQALGIWGEAVHRLEGLDVMEKTGAGPGQESEAMQLFVDRARLLLPNFPLMGSNVEIVSRICRRLDGLPLAIELAAARLNVLSPAQIDERLNDGFRLLTGSSRTIVERHRSLQAVVDWSYNLLAPVERALFECLSVFRGGWTLKAAEVVCNTAGDLPVDILDSLGVLMNNSLLEQIQTEGEPRFSMLETLREYALEKLTASGLYHAARDRYLAFYLSWAESIAPELYHRQMPAFLDRLEVDYANLSAALAWALEGDAEAGLRLCNALFRWWQNRGEYRIEGLEWFKKFLAVSTASRSAGRAWALYHAATLARNLSPTAPTDFTPEAKGWLDQSLLLAREIGERVCTARVLYVYGLSELLPENNDAAREWFEQSLAEARLAKDDITLGFALDGLGRVANAQSDNQKARALMEENLVILRRTGDLVRLGLVLNMVGINCFNQGDWGNARKYFEEALSVAREVQDRVHISVYLANLGNLALSVGDFEQALLLLNQARELVQGTPDDMFLSAILFRLGQIARFQGDFDQAAACFSETLALDSASDNNIPASDYYFLADAERLGNQISAARHHLLAGLKIVKTSKRDLSESYSNSITFVAYFALGQQQDRQAAALLGWVEKWKRTKGYIEPPVYQAEFEGYLAQARARLSENEFNTAQAEGQSMTHEQILAFAERVLD